MGPRLRGGDNPNGSLARMTPTVDLDSFSIAVRLGAAMVAGAVIGIDRELKNKPAGLRTHSMV